MDETRFWINIKNKIPISKNENEIDESHIKKNSRGMKFQI
jgi:hypothetical protein